MQTENVTSHLQRGDEMNILYMKIKRIYSIFLVNIDRKKKNNLPPPKKKHTSAVYALHTKSQLFIQALFSYSFLHL